MSLGDGLQGRDPHARPVRNQGQTADRAQPDPDAGERPRSSNGHVSIQTRPCPTGPVEQGLDPAKQTINVRVVDLDAHLGTGDRRLVCIDTLDQCKNKLGSGVILLSAVTDNKITLTAGVTKDLTDRVKAGDLMREFAGRLGGKGGGKPDMAQGGGADVKALPQVLKAVPEWVSTQLG